MSTTVIDHSIVHELANLAKKYDLQQLFLFGSRARGDCWEKSDIDIAAYFKSSREHLDFCEDVENIRTLLLFDVVNLSSDMIDLNLRDNIEKEGVLLYEKV
ncbi:MAG: nucleotidyltransferase domain-containing protein [Lachnospiraceae bacterium]|nr:nucleotidyltransferase domain-containing protein [Lachnospiraceae bacterium]